MKIKQNKWAMILIAASVIGAIIFQNVGMKSYDRFNDESISYDKGKVVDIIDEKLEYNEKLEIETGTQVLKVLMKEGKFKGKTIEVTNYISKTHQTKMKKNTSVIVNVDAPENIEPYFTIYNYDRSFSLIAGILVLLAAIILIGKSKGVMAILGLGYSLFLVIYILLPFVFSGYSPILVSIICAILSSAVTLLLLNGQSKKTMAAIVSTICGVIISLVFFLCMSWMMHINGFSSSEAEALILINDSTGLQIKELLFSGILISSLGAIMDVAMSIVSALHEVYRHNSSLSKKELFYSGIMIGKDMIGTMSNTLILAFTGSAFITLLVFISYQVNSGQLFNSNYMALEITQGICGTLGIVLTVPIASLISAAVLTNKEKIS